MSMAAINSQNETTDGPKSSPSAEEKHQQLIRKGKLILYNRPSNPTLDESVVSVDRYNRFGTSLFPGKNTELQLAAGVTSAHVGDGKTLVAANLATFFALDSQDDTVLVDLNTQSPAQHEVFGVPASPGLLDSLKSDTITISRTKIRGLWLLPLGSRQQGAMSFDKIIELRETIATLKRQFRFVIIDLPAVLEGEFPGMISSHLDGFFVVVQAGKTKTSDIQRLVEVVNEGKIIGFVMNRAANGTKFR